jgi:hypothetical protein
LKAISDEEPGLSLPEPGDFDSFYACATEFSGSAQFWGLLTRLMAVAGRPVLGLHQIVTKKGNNRGVMPQPSLRELLCRRGYGFGMFDVDSIPGEIVAGENPKLLFVRDPRYVLRACYGKWLRETALAAETPEHADAVTSTQRSLAEFLQLPLAEEAIQRYRRLANLWRSARNTTLLPYGHARSGWRAIALEVTAALKLPLDTTVATSIAAGAPAAGDALSDSDQPTAAELAALEKRIGDALEAFDRLKSGHRQVWREARARHGTLLPRASATSRDSSKSKAPSTLSSPDAELAAIFERDPVVFLRMKPNTSAQQRILGRQVVMEVDASGCRPVIGQPEHGEKTLAVYGCSFTYGIAIATEETFCSLLQGMFPTWRVENHGISSHSTATNLIQLERAIRWEQPELVTFCWIPHHMGRNVASLPWVQLTSSHIPRWEVGETPQRPYPRAELDDDGNLRMSSLQVPRYDLMGINFGDFVPNAYYCDLVCFRLLERANELIRGYGGHFFVTTLQGKLSDELTSRLAAIGVTVVDASANGPHYLCLPDDPHPNALANRIYAERIRDYLLQFNAQS